jgi:putative transposase
VSAATDCHVIQHHRFWSGLSLAGTSRASGRTWRRSATPPSSRPNWTAHDSSTTASSCTPRSGYVTPDDEHEGRGDAIRQARRDGLARAQQARIAYRRSKDENKP